MLDLTFILPYVLLILNIYILRLKQQNKPEALSAQA